MSRRRVVITGLGVVCPAGHTVDEAWGNFLAGRSAVGPITIFDASTFPTRIAAEVRNYDFARLHPDCAGLKGLGRNTRFAIGAARQGAKTLVIEYLNALGGNSDGKLQRPPLPLFLAHRLAQLLSQMVYFFVAVLQALLTLGFFVLLNLRGRNVPALTKRYWRYLALVGLAILIYAIPLYLAAVTQWLMWREFTPEGFLAYPNFLETLTQILPMYTVRIVGGSLFLIGFLLLAH